MTDLKAVTMFAMDGRVVVVTGGASGLGKMIAKGMLLNGASVTVVDINEKSLDATLFELNGIIKENHLKGTVKALCGDLSKEDGIKSILARIKATHDQVDTLVNCAGIRPMQKKFYSVGQSLSSLEESMQSFSYADMEATFRVNVFAHYYLTAGLVTLLGKAAQKGDGRGSVICFSSVAAQHFGQFAPAYQTSKAAVDHLVTIMAAEFAEFYIRVNAISPGLFPSNLNPPDPNYPELNNMKFAQEMPARRAGTEQEMVSTALYLSSAAGAYMTGENLRIDGGRLLVMSGKISKRQHSVSLMS